MRILHVLDHSFPDESGYSHRTREILDAQRARGAETLHLAAPSYAAPKAELESFGAYQLHRTPLELAGVMTLPGFRHWAAVRATARRIDEIALRDRPDVIHAHSPMLNGIAALWIGRRRKIPVIYEVRAFWEDAAVTQGAMRAWGPKYLAMRALETRVFQRSQAIVALSRGLRNDIVVRGIPADKVTLVPNGVDLDAFTLASETDPSIVVKDPKTDEIVIGYNGSFFSYEGLDLLLEAVPQLLGAIPHLKVVLVGGGPEEARLKALAARLAFKDHIRFTGWLPRQEMIACVKTMDILLYPRRSSRLTEIVTPLKPLEAMAMNKLVLASDVGGHREFLEDGKTGYLFRPGNAEDLGQKILEALDQQKIWPDIKRRARHFVITRRTWDSAAALYDALYERCLQRPGQ